MPINFSTAWLMLREIVRLEPGDWVMQNAANSNVGYYLVRLCRRWGLRTIGTAAQIVSAKYVKGQLDSSFSRACSGPVSMSA